MKKILQKYKIIGICAAAAVLAAQIPVHAVSTGDEGDLAVEEEETSVNTWGQDEDGNRCFYGQDGEIVTADWFYVEGHWYYADEDGTILTGWVYDNGNWYYLEDTGIMATGWEKVDDNWYYLKSSGAMATGWEKVNDNWYYLESSGVMAKGWKNVNGSWYYLRSSGAMATGWEKVNGSWYYLRSSGIMHTGWGCIDGNWYYLKSSGAMHTGWGYIDGDWYYLKSSGALATGWQYIDGNWYYLRDNGVMAADTWVDGYYLNASGAWEKNKFMWPCPGHTTVSSDYGYRTSPTAGASSYHKGIDVSAPSGTPIVAAASGTVTECCYNSSMGNYVKIKHSDGIVSVYMHMSGFANISKGQSVSAGTVIGYVGKTGIATGNHLHFGVMVDGSYVSPWNYLSRP